MAAERIGAVLLAAGASQRMGENKLALRFGEKTPIELCLDAFSRCKNEFSQIAIAVSDATRQIAQPLARGDRRIILVNGGAARGDSVYNALKSLSCDIVAIHDAARCLVTPEIIDRTVDAARKKGSGVAGIYARDTLRLDGKLIPRERVFAAQTPQTFLYERIVRAYELAIAEDREATDDCELYASAGYAPEFVQGSSTNQKLTTAEDVELFSAILGRVRTGYGEDTHRFAAGRRLVLGGVDIPFELGLEGHSDADALSHAAVDALLGAAALRDIGWHFPDSDPSYKGICSLHLLERARELVQEAGYEICNVDATVIAQAPKLSPHIEKMQANMAKALGLAGRRVSVKATTPEHTGPEGNMECITARCVCSIRSFK